MPLCPPNPTPIGPLHPCERTTCRPITTHPNYQKAHSNRTQPCFFTFAVVEYVRLLLSRLAAPARGARPTMQMWRGDFKKPIPPSVEFPSSKTNHATATTNVPST